MAVWNIVYFVLPLSWEAYKIFALNGPECEDPFCTHRHYNHLVKYPSSKSTTLSCQSPHLFHFLADGRNPTIIPPDKNFFLRDLSLELLPTQKCQLNYIRHAIMLKSHPHALAIQDLDLAAVWLSCTTHIRGSCKRSLLYLVGTFQQAHMLRWDNPLSLCVSHSRFITTLSVCLLLESDPPDLIIWFAPSLSPSLPVRSQLIPRRGSIMMSALKSESVLFVAKANMQTKLRCNLFMPFRIRITRIMHAFWYPTLNWSKVDWFPRVWNFDRIRWLLCLCLKLTLGKAYKVNQFSQHFPRWAKECVMEETGVGGRARAGATKTIRCSFVGALSPPPPPLPPPLLQNSFSRPSIESVSHSVISDEHRRLHRCDSFSHKMSSSATKNKISLIALIVAGKSKQYTRYIRKTRTRHIWPLHFLESLDTWYLKAKYDLPVHLNKKAMAL